MAPILVFLLALLVTSGANVITCLRTNAFTSPPLGESVFGRPFFLFGDSYADVGNLPRGPARTFPYGITWPGHPHGRFSDGHIQSDFLAAQVFRSKSPLPFANSTAASLSRGVNFAVGGAGMTSALGLPTVGVQVSWFEAIVSSGFYSKAFLESSVTLFCVAGNDYNAYEGPLEGYVAFAQEVVGLMEEGLRKLYLLGLRNIMVTTIAPLTCLPPETMFTNFTACSTNETVADLEYRHNAFLEASLVNLSKVLPGVNFILLRLGEALAHVQTHSSTSFNMLNPLKPCCLGACGVVDTGGRQLYTLCPDPENYVLWDDVHPTQAAWKHVVSLYEKDEAFTTFAPTLQQWTKSLSQPDLTLDRFNMHQLLLVSCAPRVQETAHVNLLDVNEPLPDLKLT